MANQRQVLTRNKAVEEAMRRRSHNPITAPALATAIMNWHDAPYQTKAAKYDIVWSQLSMCCKTSNLNDLTSFDSFYTGAVQRAFTCLFQKEAAVLAQCMRLRMRGLFSSSMWRRSYRSLYVGDYVPLFLEMANQTIDWMCYESTVEQALPTDVNHMVGFEDRLALHIANENPRVCAACEEAILGDNQNVTLSPTMVSAIIKSGNRRLIELLGQLLLAAKMQEGLRQVILERMDYGSIETKLYFMQLVLNNNLIRFSSVMRAMDTWMGLGFGDQKPAVVDKFLRTGYACLTDTETQKRCLASADVTEIYCALWAAACRHIRTAQDNAHKLLASPEKYKRLLALYFISNTDNDRVRFETARTMLGDEDLETLAWVSQNLPITNDALNIWRWHWEGERSLKPCPNTRLPGTKKERIQLFNELETVLLRIGGKKRTFNGSVFPWMSVTLENTQVMACMISLAAYDLDDGLIERLAAHGDLMSANHRRALLLNLLDPAASNQHRAAVRAALRDKSVQVKGLAVQLLAKSPLTGEDCDALLSVLESKSADVRKQVIEAFKTCPDQLLKPVLETMLGAKSEPVFQAGVELMTGFKDERPALYKAAAGLLKAAGDRADVSTQTEILLGKLESKTVDEFTAENGYGLYDPAKSCFKCADGFPAKDGLLPEAELKKKLQLGKTATVDFFNKIANVFEQNKDYEYEAQQYDGSVQKVMLGNMTHSVALLAQYSQPNQSHPIGHYPLADVWEKAVLAAAGSVENLAVVLSGQLRGNYMMNNKDQNESWFNAAYAGYPVDGYAKETYAATKRSWAIGQISNAVLRTQDGGQLFEFAFRVYRSLLLKLPAQRWGEDYFVRAQTNGYVYYGGNNETGRNAALNQPYLVYWRELARACASSDDAFAAYFNFQWNAYLTTGKSVVAGLGRNDFFRARALGLIPDDVLFEQLVTSPAARDNIRQLTGRKQWQGETYNTYPAARDYVDRAVDRIVTVEERRGELVSALTPVAMQIGQFEGGAQHFVHLLAALGKEDFFRGYEYSHSETKKAVLSCLLKKCYPLKTDTAEQMKTLLAATDIDAKRLVQAAMYAPQWAGMMQDVTGWNGLKSGIWFFHAHINERFSAEKETETALYSPITPQQFNDGTFDREWFLQAYAALGADRFALLYKYAKYITSGGAAHRRSQLYTDAVLGKLDKKALVDEINAKRNQERLRAYPLIPLDPKDMGDALARYALIQKFKKESRQFGAQRRASEEKAVRTALENLALTTGYLDVNRMVWQMESAQFEEIRPLTEKTRRGNFDVFLTFDKAGAPALAVEKEGKPLKTLPKELAKDEQVLYIKETVMALREQRSRSVKSLETAMVESTVFSAAELTAILGNPSIAGLAQSLVFRLEDSIGFLRQADDGLALETAAGAQVPVAPDSGLRIAHPADFVQTGCWAALQKQLYTAQIVQPFKQVFREYYPVTADETAAKTVSRRYAGHQVQPQKTVALLKMRGWTVDYEEGLQRVYYKEGLIARMYALADWFSPADIEAPTLETVQFYRRDNGEPVDFADIPPILFSETMRDIDLVVSVAHVGGVDPEASHSTVEMRIAIARELLPLLKLSNVSFTEAHARIAGSIGEYSVHMGSGVVHQTGVGMIAILPVHSQARGRLFLPFADDDPKTAEILSKIVLLAEDGKIKDPAILMQINH